MSPAELEAGAALAPIFAALGDSTRLELVARLSDRKARSITDLSASMPVTRQAIRKHLQVLEEARILTGERVGREYRFTIQPEALAPARDYLERAAAQWDEALGRLKAFVEIGGQRQP